MAVVGLAGARAVRRPRELDWRVLVGIVTAALGVAGMLSVLAVLVPEDRTVVVAARELVAGSTIAQDDLAEAHVRLPGGLAAQTFAGDQRASLVGRQVGESIHAQELVTRARLSASHGSLAPGQVQVSLPLKPESSTVQELQPGDPIIIFATTPNGKAGAGTVVVVPRALVVSVRRGSSSVTGGAGSGALPPLTSVTLTVADQEAAALADARANGELTIALAGPAPDAPGSPTAQSS